MIGTKLELRTPDEAEAVYYEAFMHCDKDVMAALWADGDVVCIHPGSGAIVGHEAVARSWAHIFTNAKLPEIKFTVAKRTVSGDLAVHLGAEEISTDGEASAVVLATNVYQKFEGGWLMIEHHGSVVQQARRENQTLQ
jgi:ketosteroid isomerase-like protein